MLKNYFVTFLRSAMRQKSQALTNVIGLTVGLASAIFIFIWIREEMSYDRFFPEGERIFNVMEHQTYGQNKIYTFAATPGLLGPALKQEIPEIEYTCRADWGSTLAFQYGDKILNQEGRQADSTFFNIFQPVVLFGSPDHPLPNKSSVSVSETLARKYFDTPQEAVGKVFRVDNKYDLEVTSVYAGIPENSSIHPDFIISFDIYMDNNEWAHDWGSNGLRTYVTLYDPRTSSAVNDKVSDFVKKRNEGSVVTLFLHPFEDDHLYGDFIDGKPAGGRIKIIRLLGIVGLFILVIACINFMNLVTAHALNRMKEVGLRKVVGATRRGLVLQFIFESLLLSFVSLVLSLLVANFLLPVFNTITSKNIVIHIFDPAFLLPVLVITLFVGLLAGSYPSLLLSSFKPASTLKRNTGMLLGGDRLRKILVVFQFSLSVILVLCTLTIYSQINYIRHANMGLDREHVVMLELSESIAKQRDAFRSEAMQSPAIAGLAFSSHNPLEVGSSTSNVEWPGKDPDDKVLIQYMGVSQEFVPLMGIQLVDGRNFSVENKADTTNILVNEELVKRLGLTNPVGTDLIVWDTKGKIIGVMKDFHSTSLHNPYEPLLIMLRPDFASTILVRLQAGKEGDALDHLDKVYKQFDPARPFHYRFLDEQFERLYRTDIVFGKLANSFTVIAILISCLGLFGLASYAAEKRMKEIGVRKVLGASIQGVVFMLCSDFTRLVVLALAIGSPIAWWLTQRMLEQYTFHIDINIGYFVFAAAGMLLIALLTVIFQSIRAAMMNPAETLRME